MLSATVILIFTSLYYVVGDTSYHKHSGSLIYEQYSASETELEKIATVKLNSKFEENYENKLEEKIFEKFRAKLETKVQNKFDEIFSCCENNITETPQVSTDSNISEKEGNKVILLCSVIGGKPSPKIKWRFANITIKSDVNRYRLLPDGALEITSLYLTDSGEYTCIGENTVGTAKDTVTLNVIEITLPPEVNAESDVTEMETKIATLRCIASGKPKPKLTWRFGNNTINSDVDRYRFLPDGALAITSLYLTDSGVYTCVAQNKVGTAQATVTLNVTELEVPPRVSAESDVSKRETQKAILRCIVSGIPEPKITWRFGDNTISSNVDRYRLLPDGALEITSLSLKDSGVYNCVAQNKVGKAQATVRLTVKTVTSALKWVPTNTRNALSLADCAVVGGFEDDGSPLWVIRAPLFGDLLFGKLVTKHQTAYVPYGGNEYAVEDIEVCCARPEEVIWVQGRDGAVPRNAIVAGKTSDGETLYVGRGYNKGFLTPGKVHPSHKVLYTSSDGKEFKHTVYDVLCLA